MGADNDGIDNGAHKRPPLGELRVPRHAGRNTVTGTDVVEEQMPSGQSSAGFKHKPLSMGFGSAHTEMVLLYQSEIQH